MDTNTLMLVMMMSQGGRQNNMLLPLLLMSGGLGSSSGTSSGGQLASVLTPQNMMLGMLPGVGMLGKMMIGGVGAVLAGSLLRSRSKRRTRKQYYPRRRSYRRY